MRAFRDTPPGDEEILILATEGEWKEVMQELEWAMIDSPNGAQRFYQTLRGLGVDPH